MENYWVGVIGKGEIRVYAGAQRQGNDTKTLPPPWPSLLIVMVDSTDHNTPPPHSEDGVYYLPVADGPARIVDAAGARLTVVTQGGMGYYFNVMTREIIAIPGVPLERVVGEGIIVESGAVPFSAPEYTFENQWYVERQGKRVTVLAGARTGPGNQKQAVLFMAVTPPGKQLEFGDGTVYVVVGPDWVRLQSIRVVEAEGNRLILAAPGAFEIVFDTATRQTVLPPGVVLEPPAPLPTAAPTTVPPTPVPQPTPSPVAYPTP
jgi:hypothetical protein